MPSCLADRSSDDEVGASHRLPLAATAQRWGKGCTIFGPARSTPHPRQLEVQRLGGKFVGVKPGYLNVAQSRARQYAEQAGSMLAPFGMAVPNAVDVIAETARALKLKPSVVWVAAGSGTLAKGLRLAWPRAEMHCVQVGVDVDVPGTQIHTFNKPYGYALPERAAPFD
jgi:threonine dehydratase